MWRKPVWRAFRALSRSCSGRPNSAMTPKIGLLAVGSRTPFLLEQRLFDLKGGNDRQEAHEQEERHEEYAEHAGKQGPLPKAWVVLAPGGDKPVAIERRHKQHVALEPHPDGYRKSNEKEDQRLCPRTVEPEQLQRHKVRNHGTPIAPGIGADEAIHERPQLLLFTGVKNFEDLCPVPISGHQAGRQQQLPEEVQVTN